MTSSVGRLHVFRTSLMFFNGQDGSMLDALDVRVLTTNLLTFRWETLKPNRVWSHFHLFTIFHRY